MTTYESRTDAITREIIEPLGEYAQEHDVNAIADQLIKATDDGFTIDQDADFWAIVANHAL